MLSNQCTNNHIIQLGEHKTFEIAGQVCNRVPMMVTFKRKVCTNLQGSIHFGTNVVPLSLNTSCCIHLYDKQECNGRPEKFQTGGVINLDVSKKKSFSACI